MGPAHRSDPLRSGTVIAVVGPSGAGKDSLIAAARQALGDDPDIVFARRVITRPADATENCESVTPATFASLRAAGALALHWQANGLSYGLPATLLGDIAHGRIVVANVSRETIGEIRDRFPGALVVHITADASTLAARLAARGREDNTDRAARLSRGVERDRAVAADVRIDNNGPLAESVGRFVNLIRSVRARVPR
jgi:ribose 1,5-bisphosphokinase